MKNIKLRTDILVGLEKLANGKNMLVDELANDIIQRYLLDLDDDESSSRVQEIILTNEDFEALERGLEL